MVIIKYKCIFLYKKGASVNFLPFIFIAFFLSDNSTQKEKLKKKPC